MADNNIKQIEINISDGKYTISPEYGDDIKLNSLDDLTNEEIKQKLHDIDINLTNKIDSEYNINIGDATNFQLSESSKLSPQQGGKNTKKLTRKNTNSKHKKKTKKASKKSTTKKLHTKKRTLNKTAKSQSKSQTKKALRSRK